MPENYDSLIDTNPFWFVSSEVLTGVYRAEINVIAQLFSNYPALRKFLDTPQATIQQRTTCFELLVHRRIIEVVDETIAALYEKPLTFNEDESRAVSKSANLVTSDAPAWVLEMNAVADWLPTRIHAALPEGLRDHVLCVIDPKKREAAFRLAEETLGTLEQVQSLIARVFDEQLQRLSERWSVTTSPCTARVTLIDQTAAPPHSVSLGGNSIAHATSCVLPGTALSTKSTTLPKR
jgi:hypothetical protein